MIPHVLPSLDEIERATPDAVPHYWITRRRQQDRQESAGRMDQGLRGAVTGGAQMGGFMQFFTKIIADAGIEGECVYYKRALDLPGFFRPTKEWDLLVVKESQLIVALEAKSQVGPSFGNNFNNRTEEAMGSALDLWTAFREGAFNKGSQPFLGYFMLEDCPASQTPIRVQEPHFKVFPEFVGTSYAKRYELFCRKLVRERHYTAAAFITSRSNWRLELAAAIRAALYRRRFHHFAQRYGTERPLQGARTGSISAPLCSSALCSCVCPCLTTKPTCRRPHIA